MAVPKTPMMPGEWMVREGGANMLRGAEAVGGHLYLTNWRLIFESHALNIQTGTTIVARDMIVGVAPYEKKLLGFIGIDNHLAVRLRDGTQGVFVVFKRQEWMQALAGR